MFNIQASELSLKQPWLIVLYKFLEKWRAQNDNRFPKNYKEKSELRDLIRNAMEKDEENYEEAIKAVNTSFGSGLPSANLKKLFDDDKCNNLNQSVIYLIYFLIFAIFLCNYLCYYCIFRVLHFG